MTMWGQPRKAAVIDRPRACWLHCADRPPSLVRLPPCSDWAL